MGITRARFMRGLGDAIDAMIMEHRFRPKNDVEKKTPFTLIRRSRNPKERWVDGTPERTNTVSPLDEALLAEVHGVCAESGLELPPSMEPRRPARDDRADPA
jgi:hypothetical protein